MRQDLKLENETYSKHLTELIASSEGRYALVVGERLIGTYETYADAVQQGYKEAGLEVPFLVRKVSLVGDSAHFSRPLIVPQRAAAAHA